MATPAVAAQIINLLYNLVDRMYIGHIHPIETVGKLALTGVGVCLPIIMVISAFAALVSMGGASRASIYLGKRENDTAERIMGNCFTLLVLIAIALTLIVQVFAKDLLLAFGASPNTIEYALSYMKIYSLGTLFVQLTLGMNAFITAQGFSKTSMLTILIGAVCNIILDPIFIFGLKLGVAGAALATIISQAISMTWILRFLTGRKSTIRLRPGKLKLSGKIILPCVALGLAPFIMQSTESLIAVCFNSSLLKYGGDLAVGAMTILTSVMQFSMLPLQGLTQGAQPIISYNYGAKNAGRVRGTFRLLLICCLVYSTALWGAVQLFPQGFIEIFNNEPELVAFTVHALRIYMAVSFVFGAQLACQQTFIALGNAKSSLFLALLRKIILLIPLIYLLPALMADKTTAVFLAEPVADFLAVSTTVTLFTIQFKKAMHRLDAPLQE
ncbi:MATE family efflux transporter [Oscillibacter sp. MSJ-2]|uniref:Multidrug export protein MepA n=1 Tax=Dysosmobacter acutus TaxID=2841504 RepID=A0ABS6F975_9FIRM|nr:MATE family efflux transporter [Dysosmobacter acutus]MBU5626820.1 MATE family efflux transporter [Dysosmobacter acutus]